MSDFIEAANFTDASRKRGDIWYLGIHDAEFPEKDKAAHSVANFFHNQEKSPKGSSAHRVADNHEIVRCVRWEDIAWAAPGANTHGVHWEQAGYAKQSRRDWNDHYSNDQLHVLARDVASFATLCGIKPVRLDPEQLRANDKNAARGKGKIHRGIVGHDTVTAAFPNLGTHTDPGPHFPWDEFMARVRHYMHK